MFPLTTVTATRFQLRSTIPTAKLPPLAENPDHAVAMCHETNDIKEFNLADFERKVFVLPQNDPSIRSRPQRGFVVCTHAVGADQRETEYVPRYYDHSIAAVRKNQTYFHLDLYMDGAEYLHDRSSITCGVRVANVHRWVLHKNEGHHVFAVIGPNVDMRPTLARLSLDLQVLDRGYEVNAPAGQADDIWRLGSGAGRLTTT